MKIKQGERVLERLCFPLARASLMKNNLKKNVLRENRKHSTDQELIIILQWILVLGI